MFYIRLGFRNLVKYRRRSLLTLLTISMGLSSLLIAGGFINYSLWGLRESIINGGVGHFQVFKKGFTEKSDEDSWQYLMTDYKKLVREISVIPGIKLVAPRLSFGGLLSSGDRSTVVMGYGGSLEEEKSLTSFSSIEKGSFPRDDEPYGSLIGAGVADIGSLNAGDSATLSVALKDGAVNAIDLGVTGIIRSQLEDMEKVFMFIPLETAQKLMNVPSSIDSLVIQLVNTDEMERVQAQLRIICEKNGLEFRTWDEIVPYFNGAREFYTSAMNIALLVILAIVVFSIANTMLMAIFDRMREIGTIRSLGTTSSQIFKMMGAESVLLGVFGCIAGIAIALAVSFVINSTGGIPLPPPPGNSRSYRGMISINIHDVALYSSMIVLVSFLSSVYPAIKAVRMPIADTLRWI